jgi:hypothetical protein
MAGKSRFGATVNGVGAVALMTAGIVASFSDIAGAQEPSPPIKGALDGAPIEGKPSAPTPGPHDIVADFHIESTALGFEQGIGPAVGRDLDYKGKHYTVADVFTANGQPCFSGGSNFSIAPAGGRLVVGLKTAEPEAIAIASLK